MKGNTQSLDQDDSIKLVSFLESSDLPELLLGSAPGLRACIYLSKRTLRSYLLILVIVEDVGGFGGEGSGLEGPGTPKRAGLTVDERGSAPGAGPVKTTNPSGFLTTPGGSFASV